MHQHFIWSLILLASFAIIYFAIGIAYDGNFYIFLRNIFGNDFAYLVHAYEPAVIIFTLVFSQLLMWIIIEWYYSQKTIKIIENLDCVLDNSAEKITLPKEFVDLENWLNLIISQNREHQHLLEMEMKEKSDTLTYLAHDLRTPLASVVGYLSLLCEAPDMPKEERIKYIKTAFDKSQKFEYLIDEFFDITRYSLSYKTLSPKEVELSFLLEQLADEFFPILQRKDLQLDMQIQDGLFTYGDAEKIARVFNNIMKNAIAYSYPQSTINYIAKSSNECITIIIKNKGKTIPKDKLERIFDKFYRTEEARSSDTGGAGLGLSIAKEIIRLHNGSITAESVDETTKFIVTLPLNSEKI